MLYKVKVWLGFFPIALLLCVLFGKQACAQNPFPGVVVAQSPEPLTNSYASPSIVILPDGSYLTSHDLNSITTAIYKSTDSGISWKLLSLVRDSHWSSLFYHDNAIYLLGVIQSFKSISIHKSVDGGNTWTSSDDADTGLLIEGRFHTAPTPVIVHNGRVWKAFEESPDADNQRDFFAFVLSAPVGSDLLKASSWTKSSTVPLNPSWFNADSPEWLEGNVVVDPNGEVVNLIRMSTAQPTNGTLAMNGYATGIPRYEVAAKLSVSADGLTTSFDPSTGFVHFPGAMTKFTIRYDSVSQKYWTIVNKITTVFSGWDNASSNGPWNQRNVLMLTSSTDLVNWQEHYKVIRWNEGDVIVRRENFGFQYVDWQFAGNDIIAVSRTAWYGSDWHDANMITFHRLPNFRTLTMGDSPADLAPLTQPDPALLSWQFGNPSTSGSESTVNSTYTNTHLNTSTLSRGDGLEPFSYSRSFSATSKTQHNLKTRAIERDEYIQFEVQAKPGYNIDLTGIDAVFSKSTTGNKSYRWAYSTDGSTFTEIGSGEYYGMVEDSENSQQPSVRLVHYRELQNIPSTQKITFRLYIWGSSTSVGRFSIGRFASADESPSLIISGKTFETATVEETPLVGWTFEGLSGTTANNYVAEINNSALKTASLTRGSGLTPASLNNSYYSTTPIHNKSEAIAGDDFYEFSVQPNSGEYMSLSRLAFKLRRNSLGATIYRWAYSIDGDNFTDLGSTDVPFLGTTDLGYIQEPIDLSGITELQNISSIQEVKFRLYAWDGLATNGGFGFGRYIDEECLALYGTTSSQVITAWAFVDQTISGKEVFSDATTTHANLEPSTLTRGNNVAGTSGSNYSLAGNFPITATKQDAINAGNYFEFSIKANPGYKFSLSSLDARLRIQENAPHQYCWRYSTDGVNFYDVGPAENTINTTVNSGQATPKINLSDYSSLQNVSATATVTFRIYAWGASGTSDNSFGIGKSLSGANALIIGGTVEEEDGPLPVKWESVTVYKDENSTTINWKTSAESKNSHFNILRSNNGYDFTVLGAVQPSELQRYQFIDHQPLKGNNYYQLAQVDFDGKTTLSEIFTVNFSFLQDRLNVYAPAGEEDITLFVYSDAKTIENLKITDVSGRLVLDVAIKIEPGQNRIKLPFSGVNGVYVALLGNKTTKFIKH